MGSTPWPFFEKNAFKVAIRVKSLLTFNAFEHYKKAEMSFTIWILDSSLEDDSANSISTELPLIPFFCHFRKNTVITY